MSKTQIPEKVKLKLWVRAGGRCEYRGCNQYLYRDRLTNTYMNSGYIAHIIADSPEVPRGDSILSSELCKDFDNLILLYDTHHRLIDKENVEGHPVELLRQYKEEHEKRIELLTGIDQNRKTHVLKFCTNINTRKGLCNFKQACEAIIPQGKYPADDKGDEIDLTNLSINENEPKFWQIAAQEITKQLRNILYRNNINCSRPEHFSVFALAPIPLLIHFGKEIGDIISADIYQKHRDTDSWVWQEHQDLDFDYNVVKPEKYGSNVKKVILNLALSGPIHQDDINTVIPEDYPVYKITIANPNRDFLKSKEQLKLFKRKYHQLLALIRERHGSACEIHLFPAIPVSIAVECGRILLPKSDPSLFVYDNNKNHGGFEYTLTVNHA